MHEWNTINSAVVREKHIFSFIIRSNNLEASIKFERSFKTNNNKIRGILS